MNTRKDPRTDQIKHTEQQSTDPGPTSGGMGSMGAQADEPSLEEKLGRPAPPNQPQHTGHAAKQGIPGFHIDPHAQERMTGTPGPATPAGMRLDPDTEGRVNTGTGDQPSNTGGSRTNTPSEPKDTSAPQTPNNATSTEEDLDHERDGGMSGGLAKERVIHTP